MKNGTLTVLIAIMILFAGSVFMAERGYAMQHNNDAGVIKLPEAVEEGPVSVEKALSMRRSTRSFTDKPLTLQDIAQMLWAAQGITDTSGLRTAPSAGALYPIEIYVAAGNVTKLPKGLYHYRTESHDLEIVATGDHRTSLWEAALRQSVIKEAPVVFLFSGVFPRVTGKYGKRGIQYVFMEAGHAAQNLLLQAEAMNLGHVPIGAFNDDVMQEVLKMGENTHPLYVIPVGHK